MEANATQDGLTDRIKVLTFIANDASEEVFLTEMFRVMREGKRSDRIKVTRASGDDWLAWAPRPSRAKK